MSHRLIQKRLDRKSEQTIKREQAAKLRIYETILARTTEVTLCQRCITITQWMRYINHTSYMSDGTCKAFYTGHTRQPDTNLDFKKVRIEFYHSNGGTCSECDTIYRWMVLPSLGHMTKVPVHCFYTMIISNSCCCNTNLIMPHVAGILSSSASSCSRVEISWDPDILADRNLLYRCYNLVKYSKWDFHSLKLHISTITGKIRHDEQIHDFLGCSAVVIVVIALFLLGFVIDSKLGGN